MTNRSDRFVELHELADETDRSFVRAQLVRVFHAAGEYEGVKVSRGHGRNFDVDRKSVSLLVVIYGLNLSGFVGDELQLRACLFERVPRRCELHFLDTISRQKRDFPPHELASHAFSLSLTFNAYRQVRNCATRSAKRAT